MRCKWTSSPFTTQWHFLIHTFLLYIPFLCHGSSFSLGLEFHLNWNCSVLQWLYLDFYRCLALCRA